MTLLQSNNHISRTRMTQIQGSIRGRWKYGVFSLEVCHMYKSWRLSVCITIKVQGLHRACLKMPCVVHPTCTPGALTPPPLNCCLRARTNIHCMRAARSGRTQSFCRRTEPIINLGGALTDLRSGHCAASGGCLWQTLNVYFYQWNSPKQTETSIMHHVTSVLLKQLWQHWSRFFFPIKEKEKDKSSLSVESDHFCQRQGKTRHSETLATWRLACPFDS